MSDRMTNTYDEDYECPSCGGWAVFNERARLVTRDCDEECPLTVAELTREYEDDRDYRAEKAFERSLSGDWGSLPLQDQAINARRLK